MRIASLYDNTFFIIYYKYVNACIKSKWESQLKCLQTSQCVLPSKNGIPTYVTINNIFIRNDFLLTTIVYIWNKRTFFYPKT